MRIALIGYVGDGNLGDNFGNELLARELCARLPEAEIVVGLPACDESASSILGRFDAVATGCGTLLDQDMRGPVTRLMLHAVERHVPVVIMGTGVSDPLHVRPTPRGKSALGSLMAVALDGSWLRGEQAPDPFWLVANLQSAVAAPRRQVVGVNFGRAEYTSIPYEVALDRMRETVSTLRELGWEVVALSACHASDDDALREVFGPGVEPILVDGGQAGQAAVEGLDAIVSFRGHLGVYGAALGKRVFQVRFSSKIADMHAGVRADVTFLEPSERHWSSVVVRGLERGLVGDPGAVAVAVAVQAACMVSTRLNTLAESIRRI